MNSLCKQAFTVYAFNTVILHSQNVVFLCISTFRRNTTVVQTWIACNLFQLNQSSNFRKSDKLPDPEELKTCCPYCDNPTEESILVCASCKNLIPYCIVTVRNRLCLFPKITNFVWNLHFVKKVAHCLCFAGLTLGHEWFYNMPIMWLPWFLFWIKKVIIKFHSPSDFSHFITK